MRPAGGRRYDGGMGLRERVAHSELAVGTFICEFMTPGIATLCAKAGADWVLLDLEHSGYTLDSARPALYAAGSEDITTIVRVPGAQQHLVSTALDAGAQGIMVPWVNSAQQAQRIASWMKYPPVGTRGSAFGMAHDRFSPGSPATKQHQLNESTLFLPQIETPEAVDQAAQIAAVSGVDVLFVGPLDLSTNLGIPGQFTAPQFIDALGQVAQAARSASIPAGIFAATEELGTTAMELGFTVISQSADVAVFGAALAAGFQRIRSQHT